MSSYRSESYHRGDPPPKINPRKDLFHDDLLYDPEDVHLTIRPNYLNNTFDDDCNYNINDYINYDENDDTKVDNKGNDYDIEESSSTYSGDYSGYGPIRQRSKETKERRPFHDNDAHHHQQQRTENIAPRYSSSNTSFERRKAAPLVVQLLKDDPIGQYSASYSRDELSFAEETGNDQQYDELSSSKNISFHNDNRSSHEEATFMLQNDFDDTNEMDDRNEMIPHMSKYMKEKDVAKSTQQKKKVSLCMAILFLGGMAVLCWWLATQLSNKYRDVEGYNIWNGSYNDSTTSPTVPPPPANFSTTCARTTISSSPIALTHCEDNCAIAECCYDNTCWSDNLDSCTLYSPLCNFIYGALPQEDNTISEPPANLPFVCNVTSLASGFEECIDACYEGYCCFSSTSLILRFNQTKPSCFAQNRDTCTRYTPCLSFLIAQVEAFTKSDNKANITVDRDSTNDINVSNSSALVNPDPNDDNNGTNSSTLVDPTDNNNATDDMNGTNSNNTTYSGPQVDPDPTDDNNATNSSALVDPDPNDKNTTDDKNGTNSSVIVDADPNDGKNGTNSSVIVDTTDNISTTFETNVTDDNSTAYDKNVTDDNSTTYSSSKEDPIGDNNGANSGTLEEPMKGSNATNSSTILVKFDNSTVTTAIEDNNITNSNYLEGTTFENNATNTSSQGESMKDNNGTNSRTLKKRAKDSNATNSRSKLARVENSTNTTFTEELTQESNETNSSSLEGPTDVYNETDSSSIAEPTYDSNGTYASTLEEAMKESNATNSNSIPAQSDNTTNTTVIKGISQEDYGINSSSLDNSTDDSNATNTGSQDDPTYDNNHTDLGSIEASTQDTNGTNLSYLEKPTKESNATTLVSNPAQGDNKTESSAHNQSTQLNNGMNSSILEDPTDANNETNSSPIQESTNNKNETNSNTLEKPTKESNATNSSFIESTEYNNLTGTSSTNHMMNNSFPTSTSGPFTSASNLNQTCSDESLDGQLGFVQCFAQCSKASCCTTNIDNKTCFQDQVEDCSSYAPCSNLINRLENGVPERDSTGATKTESKGIRFFNLEPPPGTIIEFCYSSSIIKKAVCRRICEKARCCTSTTNNCALQFKDICPLYSPCLCLINDMQFGGRSSVSYNYSKVGDNGLNDPSIGNVLMGDNDENTDSNSTTNISSSRMPDNIEDICFADSLSQKVACGNLCEPAECCLDDTNNCADDNPRLCEAYSPCLCLLDDEYCPSVHNEGAAFDTIDKPGVADVLFGNVNPRAPPETLKYFCGPDVVAVFTDCADACREAICCFEENFSCYETHADICALYMPCMILLGTNVKAEETHLSSIEAACSMHSLETKGDTACSERCQEGKCCFIELGDDDSCVDEIMFCSQFRPCSIVFGDIPWPQLNFTDIDDACLFNTAETVKDITKCILFCQTGGCCFTDSTDVGSCMDEVDFCSFYKPCDSILGILDVSIHLPNTLSQTPKSMALGNKSDIEKACQTSFLSDDSSLETCTELCSGSKCCFVADNENETCIDDIDFCVNFQGCEIIFAPMAPVYQENITKISEVCHPASIQTTEGRSLCIDLCTDGNCCWLENADGKSCWNQIEFCAYYAPCLIVLDGRDFESEGNVSYSIKGSNGANPTKRSDD